MNTVKSKKRIPDARAIRGYRNQEHTHLLSVVESKWSVLFSFDSTSIWKGVFVSKNDNLRRAKAARQDEFYTQLTDIEHELKHYREHFRDKVVFCNCDDPEYSNFWRYFNNNFEF